ncbi:lasso peptide biosynthesis B2 protein [Sphingobium sp.]|uniref:lasso peptide biosynthesis B2 protein n=1 Tax=Sphingobium sp. TaxID=1912891 RepID=UPI003B3AF3FF
MIGLTPGVTYCEIADAFIFLDVRRDRYQQLPPGLAGQFLRLRRGQISAESLQALIATGLFERRDSLEDLSPASGSKPGTSALDQDTSKTAAWRSIALVWSHAAAGLSLKILPLYRVLERCADRRLRHRGTSARAPELSTVQLARDFQLSNLIVPRHDRCLLKAVALVEFLSFYRRYPAIIFGVCLRPFSAHCWVEDGGVLLSDPVDAISHYTPILRVG